MEKYHSYELPCYDSRNSFYGKAHVEHEEGDEWWYLRSYETQVLRVDGYGRIQRLWPGYSATTMRHVNSFMHEMGFPPVCAGKKWWDNLPVNETVLPKW